MADPFADPLDGPFRRMAAPVVPVDPDPEFAARLRARLAAAVEDPERAQTGGTAMPERRLEPWPPAASSTPPATGPLAVGATITPYLAVAGAGAALEWYAEAFGARLRGEPIVMPDGRIGHAEVDVDGAVVMLAEEHPEVGVAAPAAGQGVAVTLHLEVADVDGTIDRAVAAGARLERPAADYEYGRNGVLRDPFGHRWLVSGRAVTSEAAADEPVADEPVASGRAGGGLRHGDVGYVSLWVPDVDRATRFFGTVLGWTYAPASGGQGRQVAGRDLHHGLWGGQDRSTLFCCFAVADVAAAAGRVREAGGTATTPHPEPYGLVAECTDDQGVRFAVFQPPDGVAAGDGAVGPPANGSRQGDVAYVTMEVVDATRAVAFYGHVLGWQADPGRTAGGWQVRDVAPMVGLSGGHEVATTVPMYRVDDVAGAVAAVRGAGGTATSPQPQPYGITADCTDDQGTRFYLGQL